MSGGRRDSWMGVAVAVVVLFTSALSSACSGGGSHVDAADAANRIIQQFQLPNDVTGCLANSFDASPSARRALDPQHNPSDGDLDALGHVVTSCVPPDIFAASVSAQMAAGYRSVADIPPDKEACLRDQMTQLSDDDRGLFVTGPVSRLHDPTSDRSLAVNDVLRRLLDACGIVITAQPAPTDTTG